MDSVVNDKTELQWLEWDLQGGQYQGPAPGSGAAVSSIQFERVTIDWIHCGSWGHPSTERQRHWHPPFEVQPFHRSQGI